MLTLNDAQWSELRARDARHFVMAVCDQFLEQRPDMVNAPGRKVVADRMQLAYEYAVRAGFASNPHVVRLMYLAGDAPGIHDDPLVDGYLRKLGATPEQRLDDMLALMSYKFKEND